MIKKLLIANRGEIACRVITTAQRMGMATVAVYSDADATAKHVVMADQAAHIGPAPVAESYLQPARIIQAALDTGAQAIHPGYGFLSENPEFVEAVEAAGLIFVGPPASAIRDMGLKDAAKTLMEDAGVPVVPGYHGAEQDPIFLAEQAQAIGYPVLIKARAGGGGKGMRLVETPDAFDDALASAQREAQASFGDPACLIEKYIWQPRHIEIQVFGDAHGNVVHLFERDCSLQRRHQKVIEEAPAPDMPPEVRAAMGAAAVNAAKAIGYQGAGTVEFIADGSGSLRTDGFWFMEMNTRLQVEHPVSEAITGLDFVELQLRVASGEPLPFKQADLAINGWSFEARVYAEDVPKGFLPATGTLHHLTFPEGGSFGPGSVRIDSGVRQGDTISPWYDPMIAKVVTHGATREEALTRLRTALAGCHVVGSVTNLEFLGALARHAGFAAGQVDTGLIARDIDTLTQSAAPTPLDRAIAAVVALDPQGFGDLTGWRAWGAAEHLVQFENKDAPETYRIRLLGDQTCQVIWDDCDVTLTVAKVGEAALDITSEGLRHRVTALTHDREIMLFSAGRQLRFVLPDPLAQESDALGGDTVIAPMPGLVKLVSVCAGDRVVEGDRLLVLEAMKMEHSLTAQRDGIVAQVTVTEGDQVSDGAVLLTLEPDDD